MTTAKTVRVGVMPGKIEEFAVEVGQSIQAVLELASLSATGYEVKVDGNKVDPSTAVITSSTNLVLLTKQVKGNSTMSKTVRVGVMPGKIEEYAVETGQSVQSVLELAGLSASGYEVKVDGTKVDPTSATITSSTNLVLLTKQVKGNAEKTVRVGIMPGRIEEYAVDSTNTFAQVLEIANLSATGYELKADGNKVTDFDAQIGATNLVLLTKQVKGNAKR